MDEYDYIYSKYYADVFKFLLRITCFDKDLAEDLTQETFLQAFISLKRFEGRASVKTWLIAIAKNVTFSYFRKNKKQLQYTKEQANESLEPNSFAFAIENRELIHNILAIILTFPPKTADVMTLRLIADLPFEQIGKQLHMSAGSARVLFSRGKNELVKQMKERYVYEV